MMTIEDLPQIRGGTVKQQMYAEDVRLRFLSFIEINMPERMDDAEILVNIRLDYRWWIDRVSKVDSRSIKSMMSVARRAVKKHGSVEAVVQADLKAIEAKKLYAKDRKILLGILEP